MKFTLVLLILYSVTFSSLTFADDSHLFVVSGVVVNTDNSKKVENFIDMIARKSGYKLKPYYVNSYAHLSEVLRKNPDALAWTCGAPFVEDYLKDGQQLIAVPLFNGVATYSSLIVTQKANSGVKLTDYKDKIFVYSDPRSNSGYVAPATLLWEAGYDIKNFFRVKIHAGVHEKSIEAIYRGVADVGAIDEYVWFEYIKTRPYITEKLHVIDQSGPFPFTPIVAGKSVSSSMILKLQEALTQMNVNELQTFKTDFTMDGFIVKSPDFFTPIKDNMIKIGVDLPRNNH